MKRSILPLLITCFSTSSFAQFNDSTFYMVRYTATGIINRTNEASSYAINNALRFSITKKKITFNSASSWVYGEQQHQLTNNDFSTALDANWYRPGKKLYYWGLGTFESSYSLKVNNRVQMGAGIAYKLVDRPDFFINLSDGILYEFANLELTDSTKDIYSTFRNSFRFRFRYVYRDRITLENISFLQNSLQESDDYIISTTTNVSVRLVKWISFTSSLKYNKVTRNRRDNLLVTFGITAEKYF
ncbi:MAG: DUF481 domain-containing protein [Ferruginibacter sp.]